MDLGRSDASRAPGRGAERRYELIDQVWATGGLSASERAGVRTATGRAGPPPRNHDAAAPTSIMITEKANVMCMPMMNGLLIRFGKNVCPDR